MDNFDKAIETLLHDEGEGFVANDHGRGACKWGITLLTAREFCPTWTADHIRKLTRESAAAFYRRAFWERYHFDRITDPALASKVFNLGVNIGPGTAIRLLRQVVGLPLGSALVSAVAAQINAHDPVKVLAAFKQAAKTYHTNVAAANPELAHNLAGWLARDDA
jgi:lysozyme family protein